MAIRILEISDYDKIYQFWCNTPGMGMNAADERINIDKFLKKNPGMSFVSEEDGRIVGTVLTGDDGRRGFIYHLAVAEEFRKRGIGTALLERSLDTLKKQGITKVHIFVFKDNELGKAFWSKSRFYKREDIEIFSYDMCN